MNEDGTCGKASSLFFFLFFWAWLLRPGLHAVFRSELATDNACADDEKVGGIGRE